MSERVLLVDDDPTILDLYRTGLGAQFRIETSREVEEALGMVERHGPYAVVVSDLQMPGMSGVEFLTHVRERSPDTVRIMLTGYANLDAAMEAVNQDQVFRFLTKPCDPVTLASALHAGISQYELITGERVLLERTLTGAINILLDVLGLLSPLAFGRSSRVRRLVGQLMAECPVDAPWQIEVAAMLSQLGYVVTPPQNLERIYKGRRLSDVEQRMIERHPGISHDLVARIPRLQGVASILAYQEQRFDGAGRPADGVRGQALPLGARLLKVALDFDTLVFGGVPPREALRELQRRPGWYDPAVLEALGRVLAGPEVRQGLVRAIDVGDLVDGMVLAADVYSVAGVRLITRGQEVTWSTRLRLHDLAEHGALVQPLQVFLPEADLDPRDKTRARRSESGWPRLAADGMHRPSPASE